ncbi:glycoside hydrolase family 5 protein [Paractinoplanes brasiliensis]|uniref:Cellulase (Glycosyl hydrolase family 5) n=1 Tax=Paractinoplanes brasiliensis TaxID=52695 RepID=A0A4R6J9P7_9ACTN|nr:cellulase family glycosylhydrolase [Actinoplanes brasiliensis]TDO31156.1 cellulase (glycosyl hydrolase family 5) [Actinoplanes brasiliensis]GID28530.1 endoglucanase [Actinoplanes brasiliensis]
MRALLVLTLVAGLLTATPAHAAEPDAGWEGPLSTRGRYIVDADGNRFKLRSVNWHGASGTYNGSGDVDTDANHHAGENSGRVPMGLDRAPLTAIADGFRAIGVTSVRLPFSSAMVTDSVPVGDRYVAANPQLRGKTPLQVYDAVVAALTGAGLAVILNNHTTTTRWCCGVDGNERWNTSQSSQAWEDTWLTMAQRYRGNPRVVGADLYNEVRRTVLDDPNWGWGNDHDWFAASQRLGDRILREANPDLLIIVEGINWTGIPIDGFAHERPTLKPVRSLSHTLARSGKLVYAAHFYDYTGPNHSGASGIGETSDPRYRDLSRDELFRVLQRDALYVATEDGQHFTAPVWISEFGVDGNATAGSVQRTWFTNFTDFLVQTDADFAYWPAVGFTENRAVNGWGLLFWDRAGVLSSADDWRAPIWNRLVASGRSGPVDPVTPWSMLSPDHGDFIASLRLRAEPDWDSGARKASCPDGQRLAGLAHTGNRALCTGGAEWTSYQVVRNEQHVTQDWASGYTKLECPAGALLVGYAVRGAAMSSALCATSPDAVNGAARTVWFDRSDNRPPGNPGGDFATGRYKGQCGLGEYAAGIAYTGRIGSSRTPDALLCRRLP